MKNIIKAAVVAAALVTGTAHAAESFELRCSYKDNKEVFSVFISVVNGQITRNGETPISQHIDNQTIDMRFQWPNNNIFIDRFTGASTFYWSTSKKDAVTLKGSCVKLTGKAKF